MDIDKKTLKEMIEETVEEKEGQEKESKSMEKPEAQEETSEVQANLNSDELIAGLVDKIVTGVQDKLGGDEKDAEYLKEKVHAEDGGLKGIKYPSIKELDNLDDKEKIAVFYKALLTREKTAEDYAVLKGLSEGTAADGGNLVPTPLHDEVYRLLDDLVVMRRAGAKVFQMTSQTLKIPTMTAYPESYWIGERKTKTTTSAQFNQPTLTAYKLVTRILWSEELDQDSIVSMADMLTEEFGRSIARSEDKAFFTGSGTGQPRGISIETLAANPTVGASFDFDDIINLMSSVRQGVERAPNAAFVANRSVIDKLRRVKDSNNQYIWGQGLRRSDGETGRLPNTIYGYPIYEQNDLATSELYFGDWSMYAIGDRMGLQIKVTDQNETAWTEDAYDMKAVKRVAGRALFTDAFAKLTSI